MNNKDVINVAVTFQNGKVINFIADDKLTFEYKEREITNPDDGFRSFEPTGDKTCIIRNVRNIKQVGI